MSVAAPAQTQIAKPPAASHSKNTGLLVQRQCACGSSSSSVSGTCPECQQKRLQTKLRIGASNDPLEQEADRVADQVMSAGNNPTINNAPPRIQRLTSHSAGESGTAPASVDRVLASGGRPLDPTLQQDMSQRFGHDFSCVRVHSGTAAEQSARDVNAHAYTVGHNVVFGAGQYAPESHAGRRLLAHELTHVVQQSDTDLPHRIMRMDWSANMSSGHMPTCGTPVYEAFPSEVMVLGDIPPGARTNCRYAPLFHVPEFCLSDESLRVTIRARVSPIPVSCDGMGWSIHVYECFDDGSSEAMDCNPHSDRMNAGDLISTGALEVTYPLCGGSTRNLSVRVSNGCSSVPIQVRLSVEYPSLPEPTEWERISQDLHMILDLLGWTEPFGVFFDGVNAVIYASEGDWLNVGLSLTSSIPLIGAGALTLRRMLRGGNQVIGMAIPRSVIPLLRSEDVADAFRRAARERRDSSRAADTVPRGTEGARLPGSLPGRLARCRRGSVICLLDYIEGIRGMRGHLARRTDLNHYLGDASTLELELSRSLRSTGVVVLSGEESIERFLRDVPESSWTEGFSEAVFDAERSGRSERILVDGRNYSWPLDPLGEPYVVHHEPPLEWMAQHADAVETLRPLPYSSHIEAHRWWTRLKRLIRGGLSHTELEALRLGEDTRRMELDFSDR